MGRDLWLRGTVIGGFNRDYFKTPLAGICSEDSPKQRNDTQAATPCDSSKINDGIKKYKVYPYYQGQLGFQMKPTHIANLGR